MTSDPNAPGQGNKATGYAFGSLLIVMGALWTLQGLDYVGGSFMSGQPVWAIVGPLVAGFGLALILVLRRR